MKVTSSPSRWAVIATAASLPTARARISGELFKSFQGAVRADLDALQRRDFRAGQSQRPPQERCEAVGAGESCQGNPQLLTHPHRFMHVRIGGGLAALASNRRAKSRIDGDGVSIGVP